MGPGWLVLGLTCGILLGEATGSVCPGLVLAAAGVGGLLLARRPNLVAALVLVATGSLLTSWHMAALPAVDHLYRTEATYTLLRGRIVSQGPDWVRWEGKLVEPVAGGTVQLTTPFYPRWGCYTVAGKLQPPVQYRNPGQVWHYKRARYSGALGTLTAPEVKGFYPLAPGGIDRLRDSYWLNIASSLSEGAGGLALAVSTGDRSLLPRELQTAVYRSGAGHITALSGLHVSIVAGLAALGLKALGAGQKLAQLVAMAFLLLFLLFVGPRPSLLRAVLMSAYGLVSYLSLGRAAHSWQGLLWSCFVMLCYNPLWLFDYAFVFSFAATACCLLGTGPLVDKLGFLPPPMARAAALTVVIQIALLPLHLLLFGGISPWAVVVNMVLIPLLPLMLLSALAVGLGGGLVAVNFAEALYAGLADFLLLFADLPGWVAVGGWSLVLVGVVGIGLVTLLWGKPAKKVVTATLVALVLVAGAAALDSRLGSIWFLDVGHGDAILIRHRGQWILVDCGDEWAGERAVVPTLAYLGVKRLDHVLITHPHADHAGGLAAVAGAVEIGTIWVNGCFEASPWRQLAMPRQVIASHHQLFPWLMVLVPGQYNPDFALNNNSLVASLVIGQTAILLTGDIEEPAETALLPLLGPHHLLKVAHHGSISSTSQQFIDQVRPQVAVISCQANFAHPDVLTRLKDRGIRVLRTDRTGYIRIIFWPWGRYSIHCFAGR